MRQYKIDSWEKTPLKVHIFQVLIYSKLMLYKWPECSWVKCSFQHNILQRKSCLKIMYSEQLHDMTLILRMGA